MNLILAVPLEARLTLLFVVGVLVGTQLNRGIYRLAIFHPRRIGPWTPPRDDAPPRHWFDRVPVFGWLTLSRESKLHGAGYWVRPLLIELATGAAFAGLYWWDLQGGPVAGLQLAAPPSAELLHAQFLMQIVLLSLMTVATFIDFDEKTIPDFVTVPGTLFALLLAALVPDSRLPVNAAVAPIFGAPPPPQLDGLLLSSPHPWPAPLDTIDGLLCGVACFLFWVFAIMPFVWNTRRGIGRALSLLTASFVRRRSRPYLVLAAVGCLLIGLSWRLGNWPELLSALVGMAFGGALIWGVRIVGTHALRVEAMGYGDVLLMFMIGAFLGWQPVLLVFFLAPFAALFIGLAQLVITRRTDIAFGPYLCFGALVLIVAWSRLWNGWAVRIFQQFGGHLLTFLLGGLVLMGLMLFAWRIVKEQFFAPPEPETVPRKPRPPVPEGPKKKQNKKNRKRKGK